MHRASQWKEKKNELHKRKKKQVMVSTYWLASIMVSQGAPGTRTVTEATWARKEYRSRKITETAEPALL
jgi:hypothetical protein